MALTLVYGPNQKTFNEVSTRGLYDVDEIKFWVAVNKVLINGQMFQRIRGFRRVITLDLGVISSKTDRAWLAAFMYGDDDKHVIAGDEDVQVVLSDPSSYENEWADGNEQARYYVIKLEEKALRTTLPQLWLTYTAFYTVDAEPMYDADGNPIYVRRE